MAPTGLASSVPDVATPRRGLFVLFSDLLVPAAAVRAAVGNLRGAGHDVVVFRVLVEFDDVLTGRAGVPPVPEVPTIVSVGSCFRSDHS